jgi:hypothetical protein
MRLVVANPKPVRLDGPSAAPGRVVAVPVIGVRPSAPMCRHDISRHRKAGSDYAPARAGPAQASFAFA